MPRLEGGGFNRWMDAGLEVRLTLFRQGPKPSKRIAHRFRQEPCPKPRGSCAITSSVRTLEEQIQLVGRMGIVVTAADLRKQRIQRGLLEHGQA